MKRILLLLLVSYQSFGQLAITHINTAQIQKKQYAFDQLTSVGDFVLSGIQASRGNNGAFKDTGFATRASSNDDEVLAFRGFGKNPPSVVTLPFTGTVPTKSGEIVFHNKKGNGNNLVPHFVDLGNFDQFVQFYNSIIGSSYYETNPGSVSPAFGLPIDIVFGLRHTPRVGDEGAHQFRNLSQNGGNLSYTLTSPTIVATSSYTAYEDQVIRLYIDGSGNWTFWKNGVVMSGGIGATLSSTEFILGTNSHVDQHHFRYIMYKFGQFSSSELTTVYENSQVCWEWNKKPSYPYIHNLWQSGASNIYDSGNNAFEFGFNTGGTPFSGGTGIPGTTLITYRWFYHDNADAVLFPGADSPFKINRQIPAVINTSTMASGNSITQITMDGVNLLSSSVTWTTDLATTNAAIASAINSGPQSANFFGYVRSGIVQVHILNNNWRPDVLAVTSSGFTPTLIQTPRGKSLSRTTYSQTGQIYDNGKLLDSSILIMCAITPFDNTGVRGQDIFTGWYRSNF